MVVGEGHDGGRGRVDKCEGRRRRRGLQGVVRQEVGEDARRHDAVVAGDAADEERAEDVATEELA